MRRDLFDDERGRFLSDPDLLTRLADEKLEGIAAAVREEGWGWVVSTSACTWTSPKTARAFRCPC